jgi:hypothetical protein
MCMYMYIYNLYFIQPAYAASVGSSGSFGPVASVQWQQCSLLRNHHLVIIPAL